jgi:NAD(P)-dependent dehydrogenase (short-subunit alcohol dehydrogenase family)
MVDSHNHLAGSPTALITGGASGIGRAMALALSKSGATVVVADRQLDLAEGVVSQITGGGGRAHVAALDVRSRQQFDEVVNLTLGLTGRLDYLFNNAGIGVLGQASHYSDADWSEVIDVNLTGVCNGIAAAYPHMIRQRSGHIVNTASLAGLIPAPLTASYTASKFGVVGLSRALRVEAARHGIGVTVVCPFVVNTPLLAGGGFSRINQDVELLRRRRFLVDAVAVTPDRLAHRVLRDVGRNRAIVIYPTWARLLWQLDRLSPWLSERFTAALLNRLLR